MFDEKWISARLISPLFGALLHVVELTALATGADLAAGRIFDDLAHGPNVYVDGTRLGLDDDALYRLQSWPLQANSVFTRMHARTVPDDLFRPHELLGTVGEALHSIASLEPLARPRDTLGLSLKMSDQAWCLVVLMRGRTSDPFSPEQWRLVENLLPRFTQTLHRGYAAQLDTQQQRDAIPTPPLDGETLLMRLSAMERKVLRCLRQNMTERDVARAMSRSPHTIHVHVKNIYRKLNVRSRRELWQRLGERG